MGAAPAAAQAAAAGAALAAAAGLLPASHEIEELDEPDPILTAQMREAARADTHKMLADRVALLEYQLAVSKQAAIKAAAQSASKGNAPMLNGPQEGTDPMDEDEPPAAVAKAAAVKEVSSAAISALKPKPYYGDDKDGPVASYLSGMHLWLTRIECNPADIVQIVINNTAGQAAKHLHMHRPMIDALPEQARWTRVRELMTSRFGPQMYDTEQRRRALQRSDRPADMSPPDWMNRLINENSMLPPALSLMGSDFSRLITYGMNDGILLAGAMAKLPEDANGAPDISDPQLLMDKIHAYLAEGHSAHYQHLAAGSATAAWLQVPPTVRQPRQLGVGSINPHVAPRVAGPPQMPRPAYVPGPVDHPVGREKRTRLNAVQLEKHIGLRGVDFVPKEVQVTRQLANQCVYCGTLDSPTHFLMCTNMTHHQKEQLINPANRSIGRGGVRGRGARGGRYGNNGNFPPYNSQFQY